MKMQARKFTTFDVSKICGVSVSTIVNWIESGKLKAYETLGGHRRVREEDLAVFLKENNFPIPQEMASHIGKKILIVDDDAAIVGYIDKIIKGADVKYETDFALNGFEAGDKLNMFNPDTVILDVYLQGVNGFDVCVMIKERHPHVKVIAISGNDIDQTKKKILEAGADVFLSKPFESCQLLDELEKHN
jgi:excisionase family DNA binding protein